jgi:hypothetical protein
VRAAFCAARFNEREVLPAKDEKEEVGPLRRHIVEYGGLSQSQFRSLRVQRRVNYIAYCACDRILGT